MTNLNKSPLYGMGVVIIIRGYRTSETAARAPVKLMEGVQMKLGLKCEDISPLIMLYWFSFSIWTVFSSLFDCVAHTVKNIQHHIGHGPYLTLCNLHEEMAFHFLELHFLELLSISVQNKSSTWPISEVIGLPWVQSSNHQSGYHHPLRGRPN